jgi:hypothetical protein
VLFALEYEELATKGLGHLPPAERGGSRSWTNPLHGRCWLCCGNKMRDWKTINWDEAMWDTRLILGFAVLLPRHAIFRRLAEIVEDTLISGKT